MSGGAAVDLDAARDLLRWIAASPRPAGSEVEAAVRRRCAELLVTWGFDEVREVPCVYSALPGRWATPIGGACSVAALLLASWLGARRNGRGALLVLVGALALFSAAGSWLARRGVLDAPLLRRRGLNLLATRNGREPRVWLVAHLDSKSQPVPTLVRAAGITLSVVVWAAALAVAALHVWGAPLAGAWLWIGGAGLVAGLPVVASTVGANSAGAADDASGVAAVLLAARAVGAAIPLGVLLTTAEELGLAGARAWARSRSPGTAINVEALDDVGALLCMTSGGEHGPVVEALRRGAAAVGEPLAVRRTLPGLLTDGVALADAGWRVATLCRGTLGTLARIHRPADDLAALNGSGVALGARVIAAAAEELGRG